MHDSAQKQGRVPLWLMARSPRIGSDTACACKFPHATHLLQQVSCGSHFQLGGRASRRESQHQRQERPHKLHDGRRIRAQAEFKVWPKGGCRLCLSPIADAWRTTGMVARYHLNGHTVALITCDYNEHSKRQSQKLLATPHPQPFLPLARCMRQPCRHWLQLFTRKPSRQQQLLVQRWCHRPWRALC